MIATIKFMMDEEEINKLPNTMKIIANHGAGYVRGRGEREGEGEDEMRKNNINDDMLGMMECIHPQQRSEVSGSPTPPKQSMTAPQTLRSS